MNINTPCSTSLGQGDRLDVFLDELQLFFCFGSVSVGRFGHFGEKGAKLEKGVLEGGMFHVLGEIAGYDGASSAYTSPTVDIDIAVVAGRQFVDMLDQSLDFFDAFGHADVANGKPCISGVGWEKVCIGTEFSFFGQVDVVTYSELRHLPYLCLCICLVFGAWIFPGIDVFADVEGLFEWAVLAIGFIWIFHKCQKVIC